MALLVKMALDPVCVVVNDPVKPWSIIAAQLMLVVEPAAVAVSSMRTRLAAFTPGPTGKFPAAALFVQSWQ